MTLLDDKLHEECGIFGLITPDQAAPYVALGLHALQHRGQEAGGIVSHSPGQGFHEVRSFGLVRDHFTKAEVMEALPGTAAIGHVRYSTAGPKGKTAIRDVQPFFGEFAIGGCAIAHNGTLTNAHALRRQLIEGGAIFQSSSDSECMIHLIARSKAPSLQDRLIDALSQARSQVILVSNEVGMGIVPDNALARRFRDMAGRLNQDVAAIADRAELVVAGLVVPLKPASGSA